jgi:hypothetical protein
LNSNENTEEKKAEDLNREKDPLAFFDPNYMKKITKS